MSRYPPRKISLLVRNLPLNTRAEELRQIFERFGDVRDVYLPRDYHTERPRGFGFVEFLDERDAEEALYSLNKSIFGGREISVVVSKESRKTAKEMYERERYPNSRYRGRSISSHRYHRRSVSPRNYRNRSVSPRRQRSPYHRSRRSPIAYRRVKRSYSRSRSFTRSPPPKRATNNYKRSLSGSLTKSPPSIESRSEKYDHYSRDGSLSPKRHNSEKRPVKVVESIKEENSMDKDHSKSRELSKSPEKERFSPEKSSNHMSENENSD